MKSPIVAYSTLARRSLNCMSREARAAGDGGGSMRNRGERRSNTVGGERDPEQLWRALRGTEVESAGVFLVTTPVRTVLDLAESGIGQIALDEVVADAVAIHRCTGEEILAAIDTLPVYVAARVRRSLARA